MSQHCFQGGAAINSPTGVCSFQQLCATLQMANTQNLSASTHESDPSPRPLTHLPTLPPIRPDQSILTIPEELLLWRHLPIVLEFHSFLKGRWKLSATAQLSLSQPHNESSSQSTFFLFLLSRCLQQTNVCKQQCRLFCRWMPCRTRWSLWLLREGRRARSMAAKSEWVT